MNVVKTTLAALLFAASLPPVMAHHSAAMYDFTKTHEASGEVKAIRVINPHMSLTLAVSDEKGTRDVDFEGHSINNFYRSGWRPNMIKIGDRIKVKFAPRKDGLDGGFVNGFTTAQGQEIGFMLPKESGASAGKAPPPAGK